ncbi:MAG TPA: helix-hairpin-helix domain-containing protein [Anaerolineales bacterium]|nr:helix-hairpin-helix domain-containing protein [Anaerolineales bacterium]
MRSVLQVLIGVVAGFLLAGLFWLVSRLPAGQPIELQPAPTKTPIVVNVVGAVPRPGLYEFADGSRVQDAINAAGGLLTDADTSAINLAARLEDGQQLVIPFTGGSVQGTNSNSSLGQSTTVPSSGDLVNINTATLDELDTLPGIGPTTAQKIVDYRTQHGPFQRIEDIMNVSGIGPATFDKLQNLITVGQ